MLAQRSALEPGVRVRPPGPRRWRLVAAVLAGLAVAGLALLIGLVAGPMSAQALASAGPQPQVATVGMAEDVAMAPNGSFALVPNRAVDTVSRVQTSDNSITATIAYATTLGSNSFSNEVVTATLKPVGVYLQHECKDGRIVPTATIREHRERGQG